ncbi:hypothetical protein ESCO_006378 [Escovopsis weberi]|uniref:Uncharacterized protein n=1 Tax=Escovopsis weberi TaxID=150374 RepID=A0A0M8MS61_ESCWE|nr:hypothetical protein ESCO_006378 [Escovopsis weberi]
MDTVDNQSEAITPTTPSRSFNSDPWTSYPRLNAWDDIPGINRYVEGFERYRRASIKSQKGAPLNLDANSQDDAQARGTKVTDFPTETERPSLPVTPAPVRRSSFWSQDDEDDSESGNGRRRLPTAEGVPDQAEWSSFRNLPPNNLKLCCASSAE